MNKYTIKGISLKSIRIEEEKASNKIEEQLRLMLKELSNGYNIADYIEDLSKLDEEYMKWVSLSCAMRDLINNSSIEVE